MIRLFLIILFLLTSEIAFSSNNNAKRIVKGRIVDSVTKEAISYATVSVSQNTKIIDGVITDDNGNFELKINKGTYTINVEFLSYQTFQKEITVNGSLDLGVIELTESSEALDEIKIRSEKSTVSLKIDKKVFNVGKDLISQNGSLQQVLGNVPSVTVGVNGGVSLRGNSNVTILINGKPSVLATNNNLDQIPAEQIDRIEVITNPSSRYQAAGTAGIINIILKKNQLEGISGSFSLTNAVIANTNAIASLNYKKNKLNLFSTFGYRFFDARIEEDVLQNSLINGTPITLDRTTHEYRNARVASMFVGFDYSFLENSVLTAAYYKYMIKRNNNLLFNFNYFNTSKQLDSTIVRNEKYYEPMDHNQLEISYTKNFNDKGKKLVVDFQYDFWNDDENEDFNTQILFPTQLKSSISRTRDIESSQDFLLQIDFVNPINEASTFETGFRGETRVISSDYKAEIFEKNQWEIFNNINNKMDYREQIVGFYASYANKASKLKYQLGLRTEYTHIDISDRNNKYGSTKNYTRFFPTVHLNYALSSTNSMQLSYSRRINRPSFWHINPFSTLSGGLNAVIQGNPDLDPSYTNSLDLSYLTKIGKLQLNPSLYYQNTINPFQFYTQQNTDNILVSTTVNIDNERRYGAELSLTYKPYNWMQLSGEANYFYIKQKGQFQNFNFDFDNSTWTSRINTQFKLPKQYTFQTSYRYQARNENAQTITKSIYFVDLAINKTLLKNKGALTFSINNLFNSRVNRLLRTGENFSYQSDRRNVGPIYSLTFMYRFNQKEKNKTRRPGGSNR